MNKNNIQIWTWDRFWNLMVTSDQLRNVIAAIVYDIDVQNLRNPVMGMPKPGARRSQY